MKTITIPLSLAKWAIETLDASREDGGGDLDGGYLFDLAESTGVIQPVVMTEACDPTSCLCAETGDFPMHCYRFPPEIRQAIWAVRDALKEERRDGDKHE